MAMSPEAVRAHEGFSKPWYYSLELAPGLYTRGHDFPSVALTRDLLSRVDIESGGANGAGARCLDVGIQEGLVSVLMQRRGAAEVVAYDRVTQAAKLSLVQKALESDFELIGGIKLGDLPAAVQRAGHGPFDVVVFSGVLYHMFDPMAGLTITRGLLRNGGILVLETAGTFDSRMSMDFNGEGRFDPNSLWWMSATCLDYLLRFLRLEVIDVDCLRGRGLARRKARRGRLAVACRAVAEPIAEPGDEWMASGHRRDLAEFPSLGEADPTAAAVGYRGSERRLVRRRGGSVDLRRSFGRNRTHRPVPDEIRLDLGATR